MSEVQGVEEARNESHYEAVMRHVFDVKTAAGALVEKYVNGKYYSIVNYAREVWGSVPSYMLEDTWVDYDRGPKSTVLAALIAENYMVYLRHRKMKNYLISVVGVGGSGKTTYSVLSCIGAYMLAGVSRDKAVKLVSSSIFFNLEGFINGLKWILENNIWVPCIIADDIGEWLPKYWREIGLTGVVHFFSLLDQAKDWVGVIVFTARSFKGSVAKNIRDKSDYIVDASEEVLDMHRLDIFQWYRNQDWSEKDTKAKLRRMLYLDPVPATVKMPDEIWRTMMETRRLLARKSLDYLDNLIDILPRIEEEMIEKLVRKARQDNRTK